MLYGKIRKLFNDQCQEERLVLLHEGQGSKVNIDATKSRSWCCYPRAIRKVIATENTGGLSSVYDKDAVKA